jgi:hypothetical protein
MLAGPVQHLNRASSSLEIVWRLLLMMFEGQVARENQRKVNRGEKWA